MVRFLDNFSGGRRGAASVEHFLRAGYAVIFFTRKGATQPFLRRLPPGPLDWFSNHSQAKSGVPQGQQSSNNSSNNSSNTLLPGHYLSHLFTSVLNQRATLIQPHACICPVFSQ